MSTEMGAREHSATAHTVSSSVLSKNIFTFQKYFYLSKNIFTLFEKYFYV